ncbi:MAG: amidohydrolase family protein [Dehalococcoidia bacterium]|nr:amidohydrolase family protein [Dehalococcoidia bacterium]
MTQENAPFDLVIYNALLPTQGLDGAGPTDIGIRDGFIARIGACGPCRSSIDARGSLVTPGFVNAHTHLDKADLLSRMTPDQFGGTLEQNREILKNLKRNYSVREVLERARRVAHEMVMQGTTAIRTQVDVDPTAGLKALEAILELKQLLSPLVTLEICAFPQEGVVRPGNRELMAEALRMGADLVGGNPAVEPTHEERIRHIDILFELAMTFDKRLDVQLDETNDPRHFYLPYYVDKVIAEGFNSRATATHCISLSAVSDDVALPVIERAARGDVSFIITPSCNLITRFELPADVQRRPYNSITRVKDLLDHGVRVALGTDNIRDIFYPLGNGSMLREMHVIATTTRLTGFGEAEKVFAMATVNGARLMGLDYGVAVGRKADLVVLAASSCRAALSHLPIVPYVIQNGRVVATSELTYKIAGDRE